MSSPKGQGLIETLALSFAAMTFLSVVGATLYFSLVHAGLSYLLHESLVCENTQGVQGCREEFLRKSKFFLFASTLQSFENFQNGERLTQRVVIKMPMNRTLKIEKELALYR
jgi:hypothetical protein